MVSKITGSVEQQSSPATKSRVDETEAEVSQADETKATAEKADDETAADDAVIAQIVALCAVLVVADLETRLKIGSHINECFGLPSFRLERGKRFMIRASAETGYSVSELNRMRRFHDRFRTADALRSAHPDVKTWTQAKVLLAELNRHEGNGRTVDPAVQRRRELKGINKSLLSLVDKLRALNSALTGAPDKEELAKLGTAFGRLESLVTTLRSSVQDEEPEATPTPGDTESDPQPEVPPPVRRPKKST